MTKDEVVEKLEQMAILLELAGENPFKIRAFQNGARTLESLEMPLSEAVATGALKQVKGIGAGLFQDISGLVVTGAWPALEALQAATPEGLMALLELPGLGPKKVRALHEGLGITSVGELEYAIAENRLLELPGFGPKTQAKLADAIAFWKRHRHQRLLADVWPVATHLRDTLAQALSARVGLAGELRRQYEVVEAVSLWVVGVDEEQVRAVLPGLPGVDTTPTGWEVTGLPVQLTCADADTWASELLYATGGDGFLTALEERARTLGLELRVDGLWREGKRVSVSTEDVLFAELGLWPIPPEARDLCVLARWEREKPEPRLLVLEDIQGAFHVHSTYSDGTATLRELTARAVGLGWRFIGFSDHSESAVYARGLRREMITQQRHELAALQEEFTEIRIFSGIEADILADGSLDYDDETLAGFDFVIGSVHSRHGQDATAMTQRLVRALSNPHLTMLGHMSGRLLLAREAYGFDLDAVFAAAAAHGKAIELNANPHRLDLDWRLLRRAQERGIALVINPDAHSVPGLEDVRWGVAMARKAALGPAEVWNTLSAEAVAVRLRS